MDKVLTISIAAYNVEKYIEQTLESILIPEIIDKIETFVVDDGGNDNTLSIVKKYADQYPSSVFPVHKENGGYGSTVSWSVEHANGKYFKLLDGDDWFTSENLPELIKRMENSDADAFVTNTAQAVEGEGSHDMYDFIRSLDGKKMKISEAEVNPVVAMWAYAFRTDIVKSKFRPLPLHTLYTDQIFVMYSLSGVNTIEYFGDVIYNWRIGRDEQSNSLKSITKHYQELIDVADIISEFYMECKNAGEADNLKYMLKRAAAYYSNSISMILRLDKTKENKKIITDWEERTKKDFPDIYTASAAAKKLSLLRKTNYMAYKLI